MALRKWQMLFIEKTKNFLETRIIYYVLALIGVGFATAVRYELGPILGGTIPVVIFTLPVVLAALYGGFGAGLFATVSSALVSKYLFIEPINSMRLETLSSIVVLTTFLIIGFVISVFGQRMKNLQTAQIDQAKRLEILNRELEHSDKTKDQFFAILAHELRNPLSGISTASELLKLTSSQQPHVARAAEIIRRQVVHMTKLVDDLLDVSRISQGMVIVEKKRVCLRTCVKNASEQVRASFSAKKQSLLLEIEEKPFFVAGDAIRLAQVIANLLTNSNKYSPNGATVIVRLCLVDDLVVLSVEDNGNGIDPSILPDIFKLFVQAERDSQRAQGGLGIGLSLVKQIVEMHDGKISATSEGLNRGSCFTISLPQIEG